jgi:hypothetical protein
MSELLAVEPYTHGLSSSDVEALRTIARRPSSKGGLGNREAV